MAVIALDLGGTKLAGAMLTALGRKLDLLNDPLEGRTGRAVGQLVQAQISRLMHAAKRRGIKVTGIGISVPGISYPKSGTVWAPNIPGWKAYPLKREALAALDTRNTPVVIDNDRACSLLGEVWRGGAKGCRNVVFLAVGTGIGAGVLVDGRVLRGAQDSAGSIGWMALDRPFASSYIPCGCFEHHASGEGLAKVAKQLDAAKCGEWTAHDVFVAHARGDRTARDVLTQATVFWGMAVANLVSLLNPEKIIFGGGVFGPAKQFLPEIYAEAKKWAQPVAIQKVRLQASKLGSAAALYGAGYLALHASDTKPPYAIL